MEVLCHSHYITSFTFDFVFISYPLIEMIMFLLRNKACILIFMK